MQMMLLYENGLRAEAVLLATGANRMRVVFPGAKDTTELRCIKDQWMTDEGDAVDLEALIAGDAPLRRQHINAA